MFRHNKMYIMEYACQNVVYETVCVRTAATCGQRLFKLVQYFCSTRLIQFAQQMFDYNKFVNNAYAIIIQAYFEVLSPSFLPTARSIQRSLLLFFDAFRPSHRFMKYETRTFEIALAAVVVRVDNGNILQTLIDALARTNMN